MSATVVHENNPFRDVPIDSKPAWRRVHKIAWDNVYLCGHPRGGCRACDGFVAIMKLAEERLKAEETNEL